jgi:hypothetical protein
MITTTMQDKFGFYTVGDFKTYSKLEAIEFSGAHKLPVDWNFNREKFSQLDWMQEPPGSLEFWYAQRAKEIRNKYDYIVLWYSGGADSHNALMSFVNNNIFIDEIAQFHNLSGDGGNKKTYLNEEVFVTAAPLSQHLIENNPIYRHTNHRLVDLFELEKDLLVKDNNQWDYFYKVGMFPGPNSLARSYIRETIPDYRKLIDQGKSVCFIYGAEKPTIKLHNNEWHMVFQDRIDGQVSPRTQMLARGGEFDELFYWADSMPQLVAKQAHVVKKYLSGLTPGMIDNIHVASCDNLHDEYGRTSLNSWWSDVVVNNVRYQLLPDGLHRLIYPYWDPNLFNVSKPASLAFSPRDTWMFKSNAPDIGQNYYKYGLLHLRSKVKKINNDYWWEFKYRRDIPYKAGLKPLYNTYRIA